MIFSYGAIGDNAAELSSLEKKKAANYDFSVLDVGASDKPWSNPDATLDLHDSNIGAVHFSGDINDRETWVKVLQYVGAFGKFSYSVCTHTLEDVSYPSLALEMLPRVSEAGYITMPSAGREMTRNIEGPWRGYIHHRWIYCVQDGGLVLVPKVPFIEYLPEPNYCLPRETELRIHWEKELPYKVLNDDYLGPNVGYVREMYEKILCSSTE